MHAKYIEANKTFDAALVAAGWVESGGIALWENPNHPGILIDTNACVPSIYRGDETDPINLVSYADEVALFASFGVVVPD